jgi:hypothetical protein
LRAFRRPPASFAERQTVHVVEMENPAFRIERSGNHALTAKHRCRAKSGVQNVEVSHSVQYRQNHGAGSDRWRERFDCALEVVCLAAQEDQIVRVPQVCREDDRGSWHVQIARGTSDHQACLSQLSGAALADEECHSAVRLQQAAPEVTSDRPRAYDENSHVRPPDSALS